MLMGANAPVPEASMPASSLASPCAEEVGVGASVAVGTGVAVGAGVGVGVGTGVGTSVAVGMGVAVGTGMGVELEHATSATSIKKDDKNNSFDMGATPHLKMSDPR